MKNERGLTGSDITSLNKDQPLGVDVDFGVQVWYKFLVFRRCAAVFCTNYAYFHPTSQARLPLLLGREAEVESLACEVDFHPISYPQPLNDGSGYEIFTRNDLVRTFIIWTWSVRIIGVSFQIY